MKHRILVIGGLSFWLSVYCSCTKHVEMAKVVDGAIPIEIPEFVGEVSENEKTLRYRNENPRIKLRRGASVRFHTFLTLEDVPDGVFLDTLVFKIIDKSGVVLQSAALRRVGDAGLVKGENRFEATGVSKVPERTGTFEGRFSFKDGRVANGLQVSIDD